MHICFASNEIAELLTNKFLHRPQKHKIICMANSIMKSFPIKLGKLNKHSARTAIQECNLVFKLIKLMLTKHMKKII